MLQVLAHKSAKSSSDSEAQVAQLTEQLAQARQDWSTLQAAKNAEVYALECQLALQQSDLQVCACLGYVGAQCAVKCDMMTGLDTRVIGPVTTLVVMNLALWRHAIIEDTIGEIIVDSIGGTMTGISGDIMEEPMGLCFGGIAGDSMWSTTRCCCGHSTVCIFWHDAYILSQKPCGNYNQV